MSYKIISPQSRQAVLKGHNSSTRGSLYDFKLAIYVAYNPMSDLAELRGVP